MLPNQLQNYKKKCCAVLDKIESFPARLELIFRTVTNGLVVCLMEFQVMGYKVLQVVVTCNSYVNR